MKKYYKIIPAVLLLIIAVSCSKNDDKVEKVDYPEENPLTVYLEKSGFSTPPSFYTNGDFYVNGFQFKPKVKGKIKTVILKIPSNATDQIITIWDVETHAAVRSIRVSKVTANTEIRQEIEHLEIVPEKRYIITFNGISYYKYSKPTLVTYPIDAGNISILDIVNTLSYVGGEQDYPWSSTGHGEKRNAYWGVISFVFQQT